MQQYTCAMLAASTHNSFTPLQIELGGIFHNICDITCLVRNGVGFSEDKTNVDEAGYLFCCLQAATYSMLHCLV